MKKVLVYFSVIAFAISIFSCKKDSSSPTTMEILTGSTWKTTSKTVSPAIPIGPIQITDISAIEPDSVKNFGYKFSSDGSFTLLSSTNKILLTSTWSLTDATHLELGQTLTLNYSFSLPSGPINVPVSISTITVQSIVQGKITATIPLSLNSTNYTVTIVFEPR